MRIAVDTRIIRSGNLSTDAYFIYETFSRIAVNNPGDEFIFIFDEEPGDQFVFSPNVKTITTKKTKGFLAKKIWYSFTLPKLLKKNKVSLYVSCTGSSARLTIPQCAILADTDAAEKFRSLNMASIVFTFSRYLKTELKDAFNLKNIHTVQMPPRTGAHTVELEEKDAIKKNYSKGKEFLLYAGDIGAAGNLIDLLKAFSLFKKRQKTNMQLVLAGKQGQLSAPFIKSLSSYKYREEVMLVDHPTEEVLASLIAACYGVVIPDKAESVTFPVPDAWKSGVPVIAVYGPLQKEVENGLILFAVDEPLAIAEKMMLIYKDEKLRKEMIGQGKVLANTLNWDNTATELWDVIKTSAS